MSNIEQKRYSCKILNPLKKKGKTVNPQSSKAELSFYVISNNCCSGWKGFCLFVVHIVSFKNVRNGGRIKCWRQICIAIIVNSRK